MINIDQLRKVLNKLSVKTNTNLGQLKTTAKTTLVDAINEVHDGLLYIESGEVRIQKPGGTMRWYGTTVTFTKEFLTTPLISVIQLDGNSTENFKISNLNTNGFSIDSFTIGDSDWVSVLRWFALGPR